MEFKLLVSFPDASENFVNGYEAGTVWQRLTAGEREFMLLVHSANETVLRRFAGHFKTEIEFKPCEVEGAIYDEYLFCRFGTGGGGGQLANDNWKIKEALAA